MNIQAYFLGSSTPAGFATPIKELIGDTDNTVYILKGTAGSGKSTLMKKISDAFGDSPQEIFHCSADPDSLDGVYLTDRKVLIIDGTSPHCFDPEYPGAVESIVDLGAYINPSQLRKNKDEIIALTVKYKSFHKRCRLCLSAVSSLTADIISAASEAVDRSKLSVYAAGICRKLIPRSPAGKLGGRRLSRQLAAVTPKGYTTYTPNGLKTYLLDDDNIAASDIFLREMTEHILKRGYNVIVSECLFSSERFYEHIIVPELSIAFITSNFINGLKINEPEKQISFKRFYTSDISSRRSNLRQRIKFGKKAADELLKEAAIALASAKSVHDEIERHYTAAADFDGLNRLAYKLISDIKGQQL